MLKNMQERARVCMTAVETLHQHERTSDVTMKTTKKCYISIPFVEELSFRCDSWSQEVIHIVSQAKQP